MGGMGKLEEGKPITSTVLRDIGVQKLDLADPSSRAV